LYYSKLISQLKRPNSLSDINLDGSIQQCVLTNASLAFLLTLDALDGKDKEDSPSSFPFPTEADDHCESPLQAYLDILPLLNKLCHGSKKEFTIYDPYYCNGAVKRNLKELGFPSVHNEKVDCYRVWSSGVGYPDFCVLITNPPYSDEHIPSLLQHVTSPKFGSRPWFLLLPTWVHKKDYYKAATSKITPFYLVPKKRYKYLPPKQFREKKASDVHQKSSPLSACGIFGADLLRRMKN
jgi:hypothetical protein